MMNQKMPKTVTKGSDSEFCEIRFGSAFFEQPASETIVTPEPDFEEVKHLCSNKPLQFYRPPKPLQR